jgi:predicted acyltransferase
MTTATPAAMQTAAPGTVPPAAPPARVLAVDALRGFVMFWIMGGDVGRGLVTGALEMVLGEVPEGVAWQIGHHWGGFTAWDLIMPLFLFTVGVAMPFSLGRRLDAGEGRGAIYRKALRRAALLWILGMIAQGHLLAARWDELKFFSNTLQAIAAGYLIATVCLVELRRQAAQAAMCAALLLLHATILLLVPRPGGVVGDLTQTGNVAIWLDHALLGSHQDGTPYAWILGCLGFGATTLLGVLAGHLLRAPLPDARKVGMLAGCGLACLVGGWLGGLWLPIIKHLWTPTMVLWAGGWSLLLLALFFGAIDVLGWRRWCFPFVVIGANAIIAYMIEPLLDFSAIVRHVCGGLCAHAGRGEGFALALCTALALWGLLYLLYRKRIFLRV